MKQKPSTMRTGLGTVLLLLVGALCCSGAPSTPKTPPTPTWPAGSFECVLLNQQTGWLIYKWFFQDNQHQRFDIIDIYASSRDTTGPTATTSILFANSTKGDGNLYRPTNERDDTLSCVQMDVLTWVGPPVFFDSATYAGSYFINGSALDLWQNASLNNPGLDIEITSLFLDSFTGLPYRIELSDDSIFTDFIWPSNQPPSFFTVPPYHKCKSDGSDSDDMEPRFSLPFIGGAA